MNAFWQDFRSGLRMLTRPGHRGFAIVAIATLALGIGANTAIFSLVDAVLLRPLPYPQADRLAFIWSTWITQGVPYGGSSIPDYRDWRDQNHTFEKMGAYFPADLTVTGNGAEPEVLDGVHISANLFSVLGVAPALGRDFLPGEDSWGRHRVAIVSDAFWQRRFGGSTDVLGRTLTLDGEPFTIVGVMPPRMPFFDNHPIVHIWTPIAHSPGDGMGGRGNHYAHIVGRLAPGVTLDQARADIATLARQYEAKYAENRGLGTLIEPVRDLLTRDVKLALLLLLGAVGFVLLIACVNVAGLLLARGAARQRELAVRASLGATRARLIRQMTMENVPLAIVAGAAALLVAEWSLSALSARLTASLPGFNPIGLGARLFAFTLLLSLFSALLFGIVPAWQCTRTDLRDALNQSGGRGDAAGGGRQRTRLRNTLVIAELALAVVLLAGAGLMVRGFQNLQAVDPGFARENVLTLGVAFSQIKYPGDSDDETTSPKALPVFDDLLTRVRALPGVRAAGVSTLLPLRFTGGWGKAINVQGAPPARALSDVPIARFALAGPGYFSALGIAFREGRAFTDLDTAASQPVAVVNEAFVKRFLPNQNPIGHLIWSGMPDHLVPPEYRHQARPRHRAIIGVIADLKDERLDRAAQPTVFVPLTQYAREGWSNALSLVIRTSGDPTSIVSAVRAQVQAIEPEQPITQVMTTKAMIDRRLERPLFSMSVLSLFAALALGLAAIGLFGVISYLVTLRIPEMGLRMALGAERRDVLWLVLGQGLRLALIGVGVGLAATLSLTPLVRSQFFNVAPTDAVTLVVTMGVALLVTMVATYLPARRATRVDPIVALRRQ